jgi:hypothetical protein
MARKTAPTDLGKLIQNLSKRGISLEELAMLVWKTEDEVLGLCAAQGIPVPPRREGVKRSTGCSAYG